MGLCGRLMRRRRFDDPRFILEYDRPPRWHRIARIPLWATLLPAVILTFAAGSIIWPWGAALSAALVLALGLLDYFARRAERETAEAERRKPHRPSIREAEAMAAELVHVYRRSGGGGFR